jgi:hypothetical protein
MSADPAHRISPDVRAAISNFLRNERQGDARPFAVSEALNAIRRVFPDLEISDSDLVDAIASEALAAGQAIDFDVPKSPAALQLKSSLERWEDEGGAPRRSKLGREAKRRIVNDTAGTRRRATETKDRNRLI